MENSPIISKKLMMSIVMIFVMLLVASYAATAQYNVVPTFHNVTEEEAYNVTFKASPMGIEVVEAVDAFYNGNYAKFNFIIKGDTLTYQSKIDGQFKLIAIVKKTPQATHVLSKTTVVFEYNTEFNLNITAKTLVIVNDSLELNEFVFNGNPVENDILVLNPALVPLKELGERINEVNSKIVATNKKISRNHKLSEYGLLERVMYDYIWSMCNHGVLGSYRPVVYLITPIGLIDQMINKPVQAVGKIGKYIAKKRLAKLKKQKQGLLLAQNLYEKQVLVKTSND